MSQRLRSPGEDLPAYPRRVDVAEIAAAGDVGRQVRVQLIERRIVPVSSRLQLVGRLGNASASAAHGLWADLIDAYAEHSPLIAVASLSRGRGGRRRSDGHRTHGAVPPGAGTDRHPLAADNSAVFNTFAEALAEHGSGNEMVMLVPNPVELSLAVFAGSLDRRAGALCTHSADRLRRCGHAGIAGGSWNDLRAPR